MKEIWKGKKQAYIDIITGTPSLEAVATTRGIFIQSAAMRARTGMKLPDAIHVTTSLESRCDVFITNDARIKTPGIPIRFLLSDFVEK